MHHHTPTEWLELIWQNEAGVDMMRFAETTVEALVHRFLTNRDGYYTPINDQWKWMIVRQSIEWQTTTWKQVGHLVDPGTALDHMESPILQGFVTAAIEDLPNLLTEGTR